jgi:hypothetical protein
MLQSLRSDPAEGELRSVDFRAIGWVAAIALLAALGILHNVKTPHSPASRPSPLASLDASLYVACGESGNAERLLATANALPENEPILILRAAGNPKASLEASLISYVSWPRPVIWQDFNPGDAPPGREILSRYSALAVCGLLAPPSVPAERRFGNGLVFGPVTWK